MSQLKYACAYPACTYTQETRSRAASTVETVAERVAHAKTAHPVERGFFVSERWSWLIPLTVVNVITLLLSTLAAVGGETMWMLGMLFPQVWGWFVAPLIGHMTVIAIAIGTLSFAAYRPQGTSFARRLYAGVTMSAFIAALVFPAGGLAILGLVTASFSA